MKCPVCQTPGLHPSTLESDLPAFICEKCGGIWISSNQYLAWVRTHPPGLPEKPSNTTDVPTWDTQIVKICPECRHLLIRYRILPEVEFYLDHCGQCNGVWLDNHEWDVLVSRNLQDKLNIFFTRPWQTKVRQAEGRLMLEKLYAERLGQDDYARVQEIWRWLHDHPQRSMLQAYLLADDPYKV
jgi:Zn-finger nucleic acid-binding protein